MRIARPLTSRRVRRLAALLDGSYTSLQDDRPYALFPFVDGRAGTWDDADAIAQAMRSVHEIAGLALPETDMEEWRIEVLRDRRDDPGIGDLGNEIMASAVWLEASPARAVRSAAQSRPNTPGLDTQAVHY